MRVYVYRILSGRLLHRDLPVRSPRLGRRFDGAHSFRASMEPAIHDELVTTDTGDGLPVLFPWASALLLADDTGTLHFGGPLVRARRAGPAYELEAASPLAWLARQYWLGHRYRRTTPTDVATVITDLVADTQGSATSIPITVTGDTATRMEVGADPDQPYEVTKTDGVNIGSEIGNLASEEPGLDLVDEIAGTPEAPEFRLRIAYPRLGTRRHGLVFGSDWNLVGEPPEIADGDDYANTILGIGRGEGLDGASVVASANAGLVPRVMDTFQRKDLRRQPLMGQARRRATAAARMSTLSRITVQDTATAPLLSWNVGDDIWVTVAASWGEIAMWTRLVSDELDFEAGEATLDVVAADSYVYGRPVGGGN